MAKRRATSAYMRATADIWETCEEIVTSRYIALVRLFWLQLEGK